MNPWVPNYYIKAYVPNYPTFVGSIFKKHGCCAQPMPGDRHHHKRNHSPGEKSLNSHIRILLPEFLLEHIADLTAFLALLLHIFNGFISGKQR